MSYQSTITIFIIMSTWYIQLEIKDTTESDKYASYLDTWYWLLWQIDNFTIWRTWRFLLCNQLSFSMQQYTTFTCFWCVHLQVDSIRKSMFCVWGLFILTKKSMLQGYNESLLKSLFGKFYGRYNDLVCDYKLSLAHMPNDLFHTIC
jgi:hypothetical protein